MKRALLTAAILFSASTAFAETPGVQGVVNTLRAQGYSDIEVGRPHSGKITIEAHRQGSERELVYDAGTGRLLSDRSHASPHPADAGHDSNQSHNAGSNGGHDTSGNHSGTSHDADHSGTSGGHDSTDDHSSTTGTSHDNSGAHSGTTGTSHDTSDDHSSTTGTSQDPADDHSGTDTSHDGGHDGGDD
jgi:hypothetical protein